SFSNSAFPSISTSITFYIFRCLNWHLAKLYSPNQMQWVDCTNVSQRVCELRKMFYFFFLFSMHKRGL
ncbi:hypothetical protein X975_02298, partial [Stegodyphus mimosarum]